MIHFSPCVHEKQEAHRLNENFSQSITTKVTNQMAPLRHCTVMIPNGVIEMILREMRRLFAFSKIFLDILSLIEDDSSRQ